MGNFEPSSGQPIAHRHHNRSYVTEGGSVAVIHAGWSQWLWTDLQAVDLFFPACRNQTKSVACQSGHRDDWLTA